VFALNPFDLGVIDQGVEKRPDGASCVSEIVGESCCLEPTGNSVYDSHLATSVDCELTGAMLAATFVAVKMPC
jgi:hypothetical protein